MTVSEWTNVKDGLPENEDFIAAYQGDEKAEAAEKLNIHYPDPDTLPDVTDLYTRKRKAIKQHDRDNAAAAALIAR